MNEREWRLMATFERYEEAQRELKLAKADAILAALLIWPDCNDGYAHHRTVVTPNGAVLTFTVSSLDVSASPVLNAVVLMPHEGPTP